MDKLGFSLLTAVSALGSIVSFLFGGWNSIIMILFSLVVIDYFTGIIASASEGKLSSSIGIKGIAKKIFIFALVAAAHLIDKILGDHHFIRDATIIFYSCNELLSIIENAGRVGLPVPSFLIKAIEVLKNKIEKK